MCIPEIEAFDFLLCEAEKYPGVTAKKCISGPNMMLVDNYLQMGIKEVPYYGSNINALIEDIALAYQDAIKDLYEHGCRYLQIDDTSWTYMIDEKFLKKVISLDIKIRSAGVVQACFHQGFGRQAGGYGDCNTFL